MHDLPTDWSALCALVFLLGMRHGFDADHLATIDGYTRLNSRQGQRHARWCGALFSLGHGVVVMAIALAVGLASEHWTPPEWVDLFGAWVSIAFLITRRFQTMLVAAVIVAVAATVLGIYLSFLIDSAPAPTIVLLMTAMFILAFLRTVWTVRDMRRQPTAEIDDAKEALAKINALSSDPL